MGVLSPGFVRLTLAGPRLAHFAPRGQLGDRERLDAEYRVRLILAYAREFTPRAYKLESLARAGGLSVSGVRTAYTKVEIDEVSRRIGRPARPR